MKNIPDYIVGLTLVAFGCLPFVNIRIMAPGELFPWLFFMAAVAGIHLCLMRVNLFVKIAAVYALINCFFSSGYLVSFIAYICFICALYFFVMCVRLKNYFIVLSMLQALMIVNVIFLSLQFLGLDALMNFSDNQYFGLTGQHMQSASFTTILAAVVLASHPANILAPIATAFICNSFGAFISAAVGIAVIISRKFELKYFLVCAVAFSVLVLIAMIKTGKFGENMSTTGGRLGVWINTYWLTAQRPWTGWGLGMYQYIFPAKGGIATIPWKTAHNCWLQILFETGIIGFGIAISYFGYLTMNLARMMRKNFYAKSATYSLAGLAMIGTNMLWHFPTRQIQCVPLIIFFLAMCQRSVNHAHR